MSNAARWLREQLADANRRCETIATEIEQLRKDAARYRWLRSTSALDPQRPHPPSDADWWMDLGDKLDEDFDADIDAAIAKEKA